MGKNDKKVSDEENFLKRTIAKCFQDLNFLFFSQHLERFL